MNSKMKQHVYGAPLRMSSEGLQIWKGEVLYLQLHPFKTKVLQLRLTDFCFVSATIVTNNVITNHTPPGKYNKSPASKPPRSLQTPSKGTDRTDGSVQNKYNSHTPSNLPIRRLSHSQQYQSNQSLHSDEGTTHSSNSTSPVPSPSPAPSHNAFSIRSSPSPRHTPSPNRTNSSSNLKKWSSNQDFLSPTNNLLNR